MFLVCALHGDRVCGLSRARENDHALVARVREARPLALGRLLQLRTPSGRWIGTLDVSAFILWSN